MVTHNLLMVITHTAQRQWVQPQTNDCCRPHSFAGLVGLNPIKIVLTPYISHGANNTCSTIEEFSWFTAGSQFVSYRELLVKKTDN